MTEYIVTFDGPNNSPEIRGRLIRCGDCYFLKKTGGIYRCDLHHGSRVYYNSFCSFALIKDNDEEEQA